MRKIVTGALTEEEKKSPRIYTTEILPHEIDPNWDGTIPVVVMTQEEIKKKYDA